MKDHSSGTWWHECYVGFSAALTREPPPAGCFREAHPLFHRDLETSTDLENRFAKGWPKPGELAVHHIA